MPTVTTEDWGSLQVLIRPPGGAFTDVTFLRDIPAIPESWSSGDPFGDATAVIRFPQINLADNIGSGDLSFLQLWADVDIRKDDGTPLWEGLIASINFNGGEEGHEVTIDCMGAMYQMQNYVAQPRYFAETINSVEHIRRQFELRGYSHFRMHGSLLVEGPSESKHETRYSGAWEQDLTFIQQMIAAMVEENGDQWTLMKNPGRQAVLRIRDRDTNEWTVSIRDPGISAQLTTDGTQASNVIYGEGTDLAGTKWRNAEIKESETDGVITEYVPLAYDPAVWPDRAENAELDLSKIRMERFIDFGAGFTLLTATEIAEDLHSKEQDPGYQGTITLRSDPAEGFRGEIVAGQNIQLNDFMGGQSFHIAQVEHSISEDDWITTLTVDTRARDLVTVLQALERQNDGKTTPRILQVNRDSTVTDDLDAPWDYDAGSGYMPKGSRPFYADKAQSEYFPYDTRAAANPPSSNPDFYIHVPAGSWRFFPVPASEHGSIRMVEMAAYGSGGNRVTTAFHLSFYGGEELGESRPTTTDMPYSGGTTSPFLTNAFSRKEGVPVNLHAHPALIIGWGDHDQKAGYWPGLQSEDDPATGLLRDEADWNYQLARGVNYMWGALYSESTAYFVGRIYRAVDS